MGSVDPNTHNPKRGSEWSERSSYSDYSGCSRASTDDSLSRTPIGAPRVLSIGVQVPTSPHVIVIDFLNVLTNWRGLYQRHLGLTRADKPRDNLEDGEKAAPELLEHLILNKKAAEFVRQLIASGNDIYIYVPHSFLDVSSWISGHFGSEWVDRLLPRTVSQHFPCDYVLTDYPHSCLPKGRLLLVDRLFNEDIECELRVKDWRAASMALATLPHVPRTPVYPKGINFSCVFPSFNQVEIVEMTLAGLVVQEIESDFKFEVIIVDNNSTDDINALYLKYRERLDLTLVQRRKLENTFSVPSARNLGIQLAKYDYIVGMDSDVILNRRFLENLYKFLKKNNSVPYLVTAERWFVSTQGHDPEKLLQDPSYCEKFENVISKTNYGKERDNRFSHGNILANIANGIHPWAFFYGMHTCFPKSAWKAVGGYDEVYDGYWGYDDIHFAYCMLTKGGCVPVVLAGTEVYHQEPFSKGEWVPPQQKENRDAPAVNPRLNKAVNPNWNRVIQTIPGYGEFKSEYYKLLAGDLVTI